MVVVGGTFHLSAPRAVLVSVVLAGPGGKHTLSRMLHMRCLPPTSAYAARSSRRHRFSVNPRVRPLLRAKLARLAALAQRGTADPEFLDMLRSLDDSHTALEHKWAAMARHVAREADFRCVLRPSLAAAVLEQLGRAHASFLAKDWFAAVISMHASVSRPIALWT